MTSETRSSVAHLPSEAATIVFEELISVSFSFTVVESYIYIYVLEILESLRIHKGIKNDSWPNVTLMGFEPHPKNGKQGLTAAKHRAASISSDMIVLPNTDADR